MDSPTMHSKALRPRPDTMMNRNGPRSINKSNNGNILNFFKKVGSSAENGGGSSPIPAPNEPLNGHESSGVDDEDDPESLFIGGATVPSPPRPRSPTPDVLLDDGKWEDSVSVNGNGLSANGTYSHDVRAGKRRKVSFDAAPVSTAGPVSPKIAPARPGSPARTSDIESHDGKASEVEGEDKRNLGDGIAHETPVQRPTLKWEETSTGGGDLFDDVDDFGDDEFADGEEFMERRWMAEQRRLELAENGFVDDVDGDVEGDGWVGGEKMAGGAKVDGPPPEEQTTCCPICNASLGGISDADAQLHVNHCLDGNPIPIPASRQISTSDIPRTPSPNRFQRLSRPAKPGQSNPFTFTAHKESSSSAFSRLMSSHAEDAAWATAAAAEQAARGKPAYQRMCPFYKILPGFYICVDAFRYGAVEGCHAYFLSHFHSDHYVGLTSSWQHGPIYCSHVTANLVRQQLRVNPKYVVDLEFEKKMEVPGTKGVEVTMIPANHCPGSSLFMFEKVVGRGAHPKVQRVLHCGDFRACPAHLEHALLRPDVMDVVTGKSAGRQKIDVCYLDTTYLNPRYAFPAQEEVIRACADMCVSLKKERTDENDAWETTKRERAGSGMTKFVTAGAPIKGGVEETAGEKSRGRLLVVVGTYSIGKERICLGIAKALESKIFAPPGKQRICACLKDAELNARLTSNPHEAQVHMTPLFEIRAETLQDYLNAYKPHFSRVVGFRPSGWNYKPPNSRFVESPAVSTVLRSSNWRSNYSMADLVPQRGSSRQASCFGVPYSEHSSFRELTMFCCALRIDKIIPTVNVGSAKSREKMKAWFERWALEKKKNGLFVLEEGGW
ncbi:MAG: hypothetical protein M1838_004768 [Thelocarpon superellum]|nr:MAG: hypothetical protein M1838_004768 [Thelocarpon superellum]